MSDELNGRDDDDSAYDETREDAPRRKLSLALIAAVLLVLSGFAYLMYGGIADNLVWNMTPKQLLAKGTNAYGHAVRLGGQVAPGSVQWDEGKLGVRFRIRDEDGTEIHVQSKAIPTAMFREGIGVVVEGKLVKNDGAAQFHATNLMVKHSNEYKPPAAGHPASPEAMNRTLITN